MAKVEKYLLSAKKLLPFEVLRKYHRTLCHLLDDSTYISKMVKNGAAKSRYQRKVDKWYSYEYLERHIRINYHP